MNHTKTTHVFVALLAVAALTMLVGCAGPQGTVKASAIKPLVDDIRAYHDAKVTEERAAGTLTVTEADDRLRSTEILSKVINEAAGQGQ